MPSESAYLLAKHIEADIKRLLSHIDAASIEQLGTRRIIQKLRHDVTDARLEVRDYEFAESRAEQAEAGTEARRRLQAVRDGILAASEYNSISAVDVAVLSADIDYLLERLA